MWLLQKCQEGGFLNFPRQLITAGLPFIKNILIPLAKKVLIPLGLIAAVSQAAIWKKDCWIWHDWTDNFKLRNEWYGENS